LIEQKIKSAIFWSAWEIFSKYGINFLITIILARLIAPAEFGFFALVTFFINFSVIFIDAGFSSSLIQDPESNLRDESTIFWANLVIGALAVIFLWVIAPLVANFYVEPRLAQLLRFMSLNVIISALSSVQIAIYTKELNFEKLVKINLFAAIISSILAVWFAYNNFGIWALAVQAVSQSLLITLLLWIFSKWRPIRIFDIEILKKRFSFSGYIFLSTIFNLLFSNIYALILGRMNMMKEIGYYQRAVSITDSFSSLLSNLVAKISFPIFSKLQMRKVLLKRGVKNSLRLAMLFNAPIMMGLFAVADNLVPMLYGDAWDFSVQYVRILAIAGILMPVHSVNLSLLLAQGASNDYFKLEILKKITATFFVVIGASYFGVLGVALATLLFSPIGLLANTYFTKSYLTYSLRDQLSDVAPSICIASLMAAIVYLIPRVFASAGHLCLPIQIVSGVLLYWLLTIMFNNSGYKLFLSYIQKKSL